MVRYVMLLLSSRIETIPISFSTISSLASSTPIFVSNFDATTSVSFRVCFMLRGVEVDAEGGRGLGVKGGSRVSVWELWAVTQQCH